VKAVLQSQQRAAIMKLASPETLNTQRCLFSRKQNGRSCNEDLPPEECSDARRLLVECLSYGCGPQYSPQDKIAGDAKILFYTTSVEDVLIGLEYCHGMVGPNSDDVGTLLVRTDSPEVQWCIVNLVPVNTAMKARIDDIFMKAEQNPKAVRTN
jgi:hypothetical protein